MHVQVPVSNLHLPDSERDLFSLGLGSGIYHLMNSSKTTDEALDEAVDKIVSGLFSVCVTMASIPIIRCAKGGAAELIAPKVSQLNFRSFNSLLLTVHSWTGN